MSSSSTKRASTRTVVLSKAMRYVDEDTRREFHNRRLQSLECDNYVEGAGGGSEGQDSEDAYGGEDDSSEDGDRSKKRKRSSGGSASANGSKGGTGGNNINKPTGKNKRSSSAGSSGLQTGDKKLGVLKPKWSSKATKSLERILMDNGISPNTATTSSGGGGAGAVSWGRKTQHTTTTTTTTTAAAAAGAGQNVLLEGEREDSYFDTNATTHNSNKSSNSSSSSSSSSKSCNTCGGAFPDAISYRQHFRSEWHRQNLNRKMKGEPVLLEADFLHLQQQLHL